MFIANYNKGEKRLKLIFDYQLSIVEQIKTITGRKYSRTLKTWHIPYAIKQSTDLRYIQKILGHNNIKITTIYTKVSKKALNKIRRPLDKIFSDFDTLPP